MGLFNRLFNKHPKVPEFDYSSLKTDLHSHLIPGIDDGSKTMDDTLNMLRKFIDLGYKKVITTPHIMSDYYKNTPEIIKNGLAAVREAIKSENLPIAIEAAAEYYLDFHFDEEIEKRNLLTFGDNHVLFELSFSQEQPGIKNTVFNLITQGYKPILAHVERYPFYINDWDKMNEYKDRGVLLQLNINSLSGQYGPHVKKMAEQLIERDLIDVIGSDCHHMGHLELMNSLRTNPHLKQIIDKPNLLNYEL
ncbi:tyrosine-protein phosphatase [Crocinitomix algicola]|uniref:tyrosine-protein phosphatase n=1 Tax=Crocinitomix algicola TaxID=1740263 RepID=UPI0008727628|nr:CpsB/CapC family capsule biosynthesis tyrosine phosphatase [Crocinitomix algicola]